MNNWHNLAAAWKLRLVLAILPLAAVVLALVLIMSASAATVIKTDIPVSGSVFNPCNGENVTFSGVDNFTVHLTLDNSGGFHSVQHDNVHVTAFGDQGNTYVGNQEDDTVLNGHVGIEETSPLSVSLISKGSAPNFDAHAIYHVTVNANGTFTAVVDHYSATCRG